MNEALCRPFYAEYAWAFDLIIDRPVEKECAVIGAWLVGRGILPGAEILDAGCGTGRYSRELARRGYIVLGVDLSPELMRLPRGRSDTGPAACRLRSRTSLPRPLLDMPQYCAGASSMTSLTTTDATRSSQHSPGRFDQTAR